MNIKDCGYYAFPVPSGCMGDYGMTLRDYFAAAALQGICARAFPDDTVWERPFVEYAAPFAYEIADAMLKARGEIET